MSDECSAGVENENIVQELRNFAYIIKEAKGVAVVTMLESTIFDDAADEIERLCLAGDALAIGVRTGRYDDALDEWEKVRRD
jgi:hypothetical protein